MDIDIHTFSNMTQSTHVEIHDPEYYNFTCDSCKLHTIRLKKAKRFESNPQDRESWVKNCDACNAKVQSLYKDMRHTAMSVNPNVDTDTLTNTYMGKLYKLAIDKLSNEICAECKKRDLKKRKISEIYEELLDM